MSIRLAVRNLVGLAIVACSCASQATPPVLVIGPADVTDGPARPIARGAFVFVTGRESQDHWRHPQLYLVSPGLDAPINLTRDANDNNSPAVSPDGRSLAYVSDRDGPTQLLVMDLATRDSHVVETPTRPVRSPRWSPSGDAIAYLAPVGRPAAGIAHGDAAQIAAPAAGPRPSPRNGTAQIAGRGRETSSASGTHPRYNGPAVWIVDRRGGRPRQLTRPGPSYSDDGGLAFIDGGKWIVFSRYDGTTQDRDLYIVAADGSGPARRVTRTASVSEVEPVTSHDGRLLAYRVVENHGPTYREWIRVVSTADGKIVHDVALPPPVAGNLSGIDFSADDRSLIFGADASDVGGSLQNLHGEIFSIDLRGAHLRRLTKNAAYDGEPTSIPQSRVKRGDRPDRLSPRSPR